MVLAAESQLDDITRKLMRIGLDNIMGYIPNTDAFVAEGGELDQAKIVDTNTFKEMLSAHDLQVVDLRGTTEYKQGHINGADHVFIGTLLHHLDKISKDKKVVIHCQGGDRSTIGYSLLAANGYTNVMNYSDSVNGWLKEGNALVASE